MRRASIALVAILIATIGSAKASQTKHATCNEGKLDVPAIGYTVIPGDIIAPYRLQISRNFSRHGQLYLDVCHANLRIVGERRSDKVVVRITVTQDRKSQNVKQFVRTLQVHPRRALIRLDFPNDIQAFVSVAVPMGRASRSVINLQGGDLRFDSSDSHGNTTINVGGGGVLLRIQGEHDYAAMQIDIDRGRIHGHLPGSNSRRYLAFKTYHGTGSGRIEVNVAGGDVYVRQ